MLELTEDDDDDYSPPHASRGEKGKTHQEQGGLMTNTGSGQRLASRILPAASLEAAKFNAEAAPSRRALNPEDKARGRRMLGLMIGTLTTPSAPNARQREVEERLAQRLAAEKEALTKEMEMEAEKRRQENEERRKEWEQGELDRLETGWERQKSDLAGFMLTESEPRLYWRPSPESTVVNVTSDPMAIDAPATMDLAMETDL